MSVIEAAKKANPRILNGDMVAIGDVKRLIGRDADAKILEAFRNREIWIHGTDRGHMMSAAEQAAELIQFDGRFFNTITLR